MTEHIAPRAIFLADRVSARLGRWLSHAWMWGFAPMKDGDTYDTPDGAFLAVSKDLPEDDGTILPFAKGTEGRG